jgi:hypothetical protein
LSDYLQDVKILGGLRATAMQSLQLHLTGAAWSWLSKLPNDSIGSWSELAKQFTSNFRSTYMRPASIEEVKSCIHKSGEALRSYIQRWSIIKNLAENVSDERAIDAFVLGLCRSDLVEEMGRTKPKTVSELMEIANRFADGEDAYHNKRAWSPEHDRPNRYNNQRRRSRNDDGHHPRNQVAAWYKRSSEEGGERRNNGYRRRDDSGGDRSRNFDLSPKYILNGPCHIHYAYIDGKRVSNHLMTDCRTFMKLQEAIVYNQAEKLGSTAYGAPPLTRV